MSAAMIQLSEDFSSMTYAEGLAYIERTRRRMDRFQQLPGNEGRMLDPIAEAEMRQTLDELENSIHISLG